MIMLTKYEQEELAKQLLELQQLLYKPLFDKDSETAKAFDIISKISKEIIEPDVIKKVLKEQINSSFGQNKKEKMTELKTCPICSGKAQILCCDYDYKTRHAKLTNIVHEENTKCPIAKYSEDGAMIEVYIYDSEKRSYEKLE